MFAEGQPLRLVIKVPKGKSNKFQVQCARFPTLQPKIPKVYVAVIEQGSRCQARISTKASFVARGTVIAYRST
jgi:hypothetical protein